MRLQLATLAPVLIRVMVLAVPILSSPVFAATPKWECSAARWSQEPKLEAGSFTGTMEAVCEWKAAALRNARELDRVARGFLEHLKKTRDIHSLEERGRGKGWKLDTTLKAQGGRADDAVRVREWVEIDVDRSGVSYATDSQSIEAQGLAGYLKHLAFRAEVRREALRGIKVRVTNSVRVEQPWFAIGAAFVPIARNVTADRFKIAVDRLLPMLERNL